MILAGQSGNAALAAVPVRLRPGVQALLFQVLRQLGRAQVLRKQLAPKAPPAKVDALLCTALALAWNPEQAPYEPFTLVNQTVEAAKRAGLQRQAGFMNACLRRFLREREALVAATDHDTLARFNHPQWWVDRLQKDHPQDWQRILAANNAQAPMSLRVNKQKSTPAQYQQALAAMDIDEKKGHPMKTIDEMLHLELLSTEQHAFIREWIAQSRTPERILQMPAPMWQALEQASERMGIDQDLLREPALDEGFTSLP